MCLRGVFGGGLLRQTGLRWGCGWGRLAGPVRQSPSDRPVGDPLQLWPARRRYLRRGFRERGRHRAVALHIDGDGDLDLCKVGAGTGSISNPDNRDFWNKVLLNDDGRITSTNVADDFGLDYGPARGRIMVPLELEGRTGMLLASTARPDGDWASTILIQRNDGSFRSWGQEVAQSGDTFGIGARLDGDAVTVLVLVYGTKLRIHERGPDGTTLAPLSGRVRADHRPGDRRLRRRSGRGHLRGPGRYES